MNSESQQLKNRYFVAFSFFEYRKIMRSMGGEVFDNGRSSFLATSIVIMWIIVFLINGVYIDGNKLVIQFSEKEFKGPTDFFIWFFLVAVLESLLSIIVATTWQVGYICEIFFGILLVTIIILVALESTNNDFIGGLIIYLCSSSLFCVSIHYLFNYYLAPKIILWKYGHIVNYRQDEFVTSSNEFNEVQFSKQSDNTAEITNDIQESRVRTMKNKILNQKLFDPEFKRSVVHYPFKSNIFIVIYALINILYWPIFLIVFICNFILNAIGVIEWEFLRIRLFHRLEESYWVFKKLKTDENDEENLIDDCEQISYSPSIKGFSLWPYLNKNKKPMFFQYNGNYDSKVSDLSVSNNLLTETNPTHSNLMGKPHGYGEWKDSHIKGETCGGLFIHGMPVAPFLSREKLGQGTFRNQRIGYVTISGGNANDIDQGRPRFISDENGYNGLCYGVAEVECCVSGTFYYGFPRTNFMLHSQPPNVSMSVEDTWKCLMEPYIVDKTIASNEESKLLQLEVNGMTETMESFRNNISKSLLVTVEEVLIFIPGFNSSLRGGLNTYGQFWQLAGFPNSISPILFCWPQGAIVTYFQAKAAAQANEAAIRLYQMLYDLKTKCGVQRVNLIGHSMGARVLASFFDKFNQISIDSTGKAVMKPTEPSITITSNTALNLEEGKVNENIIDIQLISKVLPKFGAVLFVNAEADLSMFQSGYKKCMHQLAESISVIVDTTDFALFNAQQFNYLEQWHRGEPLDLCLGRCETPIYDNHENNDKGTLLDVDVINASGIAGGNVDKNRHCYFHLSRQTLEDMRELIVSRKRAKLRKGRLLKYEGNLYDFLVAPPYISKL